MIYGVGTDLVSIARMEALWKRHGARAVRRILTLAERQELARRREPARYLALRFAAKEAVAKALGTGFAAGVSLQSMSILADAKGKPVVDFAPGRLAERLREAGIAGVELSLTDELDWALAFAVAWGAGTSGPAPAGSSPPGRWPGLV
jgi:holo-[acyl-carrier protein] synthase